MEKIDKTKLGYLGAEFQYRLVKMFIEEPKYFEKMESIIDQNMFTENSLRNIVRIMKDEFSEHGNVPDYVTINTILGVNNTDNISLTIDRECLEKVKTETILQDYDVVKETAERFFKQQNMIRVANKVLKIAGDGDLEQFDECKDEFERVVEIASVDDDEENPMDDLDEALSAESVETIPTGIPEIDFNLGGGLDKGKLGLVIGPAGFGKTTMMTAFGYHAATHGKKVLQIIFEDEIIDIRRKFISRMTGKEAFVIKAKQENGGLTAEERKALKEEILANPDNELLAKNLRIKRFTPGGGTTISDIIAYIKRTINKGFKPDLVTIDYFEAADQERGHPNKSEWTLEGIAMRKLEGAAKELGIAIWIPSQGGRDSFTAQIVNMSMGGGSIKKQQIAQVVMSISRTLEDIDNNTATLTILKNRAGRSGASFEGIYFNNGTCQISFDHVKEHRTALELKQEIERQKMSSTQNYAKEFFKQQEAEDDLF
jgi:replicative DNA helicase